MPTFTAVVTSHANERGLRKMLGNLRYQTRPADETIVLCSDTPDLGRLREDFEDVEFLERPNRNDWGHEKRSEGLERAAGDWVGFFNDDDSYSREYLAKMLARTPGHDVVYCGWSTYPDCRFHLGSSTSGNFIVRRGLALRVGYPATRVYENDGHFIDALNAAGARVARVDEVLYQHNRQ